MIGRNVFYGYLKLRAAYRKRALEALDPALETLQACPSAIAEQSRDPCPEDTLFVVLEKMLDAGLVDSAVAAALQYDVYACPSEITELLTAQVIKPRPGAGKAFASTWSINFGPSDIGIRSKTGEQDDVVKMGGSGREFTTDIVRAWHLHVGKHELFFPHLSLARLEADLGAAATSLGLEALHLTPHVIRHSGPSNDRYLKRVSRQEAGRRGRWGSDKSLNRYEKHGKLLRQIQKVPADVFKKAVNAKKRFSKKTLGAIAALKRNTWRSTPS